MPINSIAWKRWRVLNRSLRKTEAPLTAQAQRWLLASLLLVILPHAARLPWWISMFAFGMGAAHILLLRHPAWKAPRLLVFAATLAGAAGVFLTYDTLLGRNAGVALLVVMLALKLLELRRMRDIQLMIFLNYFLVITNFLFSQTPLIALYMIAATVVNTAALGVATQARAAHPVIVELRFAAVLLTQSLPVMLVLFVLFPRVSGPIWGLPEDAYSGVTGLSDSMSPGAISQLAQSEAVAFRVKFSGYTPPPQQRYWRGPVLWHTDGRTWSTGRMAALLRTEENPVIQAEGGAVHQSIMLEGQRTRWLVGLDVPVEVSVPAINTAGFQWISKRSLRERTRYEVVSYPRYRTGYLDPRLREAALQLPNTLSTRIQTLVQSWRDNARTDRDVARLALDYFHNEPFVYTLTPPLLGQNPLDEFLFSSRRGFCEHYAAAFVMLMRSAGIPARVVTGYQGGEYNPVGDYWLIRQADAHAWAEIWLPDAGWTRVDPTMAVAPERIEHALDPGILPSGAPARFQLGEDSLFSRSWRRLRYSLDAVNNSWDQWVLSYGPELQREVLTALGLSQPSWWNMILLLALLVSTLLLGIAGWLLIEKSGPSDPVLRAYRVFCVRVARLGVRRQPSEGPRDFSRRIIGERPELERQVNRIIELFVQLRYGSPTDRTHCLTQLRRLVRRFPQDAV
jgi:transglutaminase-like putative cysteine protease